MSKKRIVKVKLSVKRKLSNQTIYKVYTIESSKSDPKIKEEVQLLWLNDCRCRDTNFKPMYDVAILKNLCNVSIKVEIIQ